MNAIEVNRHTTPPGGWQFRQPQTGWQAPTPVSSTFDQTVILIIKHRQANPVITAKFQLPTAPNAVGNELENYTRVRLGLKAAPLPKTTALRTPPVQPVGPAVAVAADGDKNSVAYGIKRAAQGTAVLLDWLSSGGAPVAPELANKRAAVCASCGMNRVGDWYTVAPAQIIKETLAKRADVKLETGYDAGLNSCHVCRCLLRLKIWCPLDHIVKRTKPEIMKDFPANCWIAKRDK